MKKILVLILSLFVFSTFAQQLPYHPYRKVGEKYYDLNPLYSWIQSVNARESAKEEIPLTESINRPMKDWYGVVEPYEGILRQFVVIQILDEGILVQETRFNPASGDTVFDSPFFLKNYPGFTSLTDNQKIRFLAVRNGVYKYTDTSGALRTVPMYDYGVPYDPWELAKQKKSAGPNTNQPALK